MQRILLVEDEPAVRFAMSVYLDSHGFAVDVAEDLSTALARLADGVYDVVLTDLRLGGDTGTEGLDVIREARTKVPRPVTILLTAWGTPEVEAEALALGVDHFDQKPIELEILVRKISTSLQPSGERV